MSVRLLAPLGYSPLRNYLKKANALFPPTLRVFGSWGHIPQTPCQRGRLLWTPRTGF